MESRKFDIPRRGEAAAVHDRVSRVKLTRVKEELAVEDDLLTETKGQVDGVEVHDLHYHSGRVTPGSIFVCIVGENADGHCFAQDAVEAGAAAVIVERTLQLPQGTPQLLVSDSRRAMAVTADLLYGHPTGKLLLIGVTGTSGKTTTTYLTRHLLEYYDRPTGLVGTVATIVGGKRLDSELTTPESADLQRLFRQMVDAGDQCAVMEASSHALSLARVLRCSYNIGIFTNLAPEHLDFHRTMDNYLEAKARLFSMLSGEGADNEPAAVVNADDPYSSTIVEGLDVRVVSYGIEEGEVRASDIRLHPDCSRFELHLPGEVPVSVEILLPGRFNVYNALAAAAACWWTGFSAPEISEALATAEPVPGRFEVVSGPQDDIVVIVDFAHTPDELENLLETVRDIAQERIIVAFGAGGDRDKTKRPVMGEIAHRLADWVVVTSDNPRSEDPQVIAEEVVDGMKDTENCEIRNDRADAVRRCIEVARSGDVVVLAGKGHETYQVFAEETVHYDDRQQARFFLRERRRRGGRTQDE